MRRLLCILAALLAASCAGEDAIVEHFVEDYCEAAWECGCEGPGLTQVHCGSTLTNDGMEAQQEAQDAGLEYDRQCAREWLDAVDASCGAQERPTSSFGTSSCGSPCPPYHGDLPIGAACRKIGPFSDCAKHLSCGALDTCEDPCQGHGVGDGCPLDVGLYCGVDLVCVGEGGGDGTCRPAPTLGEPCSSQCTLGSVCDRDTNVCVQAPGLGEPCGFYAQECAAYLRCVEGTCEQGRATVCALGTPW